MSNTIGTMGRIIGLFILLAGGWFLAVTALYILITLIVEISFSWVHLWVAFGSVLAIRMFYPRNVFSGSL